MKTKNREIPIHLFSVEDYHRLGEVGILTEDDRVELIEGRIVDMTPIGSRHASCVDRLNNILIIKLQERFIVRSQNPVDLLDQSEPEPDITILKKRGDFYQDAHPQPKDVLLIIEVADTSLGYERNIKIPLYARAMIQEVWLVNLIESVIEVYRSPSSEGYHIMTRLDHTQSISPQSLPDIVLSISEILSVKI